MKRILTFVSVALAVVAGTVSCNNDPKPDGVAQVTSFSLKASLNSTLPSDVDGTVDNNAGTITVVIPEGAGSEFIPTFAATQDDVVKSGSTVLTSGVTSITITDGSKLTVSDEVSQLTTAYTFSVKENDAAAELKSVAFLQADNEALTADVAAEEIASEMLVRVPGKAFKSELVMTVEAGKNDVVTVNGEAVKDGKVSVDTSFPVDIKVTDEVAGAEASYVLKVGKVLEYVVTKVASITDGTKIFSSFDMAINPADGNPWIAYVKEIEGDKIDRVAVQKFDGTSFSFVGGNYIVPDPDSKDAKNPSLVFAGDGTAFLKYLGGEASSKFTVRKFTSSWEVVGKASFNSANANISYAAPLFIQSNGQPAFFFTGNTKKVDTYRTITSEYYTGSEWVEKVAAASGVAPAYGEPSSSAGFFYGSSFVTMNGKTYMLASFNQWGYFVYEVGDGCKLTPVVYDYKPGTSTFGIASNGNIMTDGDNLYVYASDYAASKMQVYKVDLTNKTMGEYGAGFPVTVSSLSGVSEMSAVSVSPSGLFVAAVEDSERAVSFKYLNSSLQWETFSLDEAPLNCSGQFRIVFNSDGVGYIAYPGDSAGNIEVYKVALEADVLPE